MFHCSVVIPTEKSLKQPYRKLLRTWQCSWRHKLTLKCEVAFFSKNSKVARLQLPLQLDGSSLNTAPLPKFLGVTIDRAVSFGLHVAAVYSKAPDRCQALASLTCKRWGSRKYQLLKVYRALRLSFINYAAPAWKAWLAPTRLDQLERCQNKAPKILTSQLKTNPLKVLKMEARVSSITVQVQQQAAVAYEKAHRLPTDYPA